MKYPLVSRRIDIDAVGRQIRHFRPVVAEESALRQAGGENLPAAAAVPGVIDVSGSLRVAAAGGEQFRIVSGKRNQSGQEAVLPGNPGGLLLPMPAAVGADVKAVHGRVLPVDGHGQRQLAVIAAGDQQPAGLVDQHVSGLLIIPERPAEGPAAVGALEQPEVGGIHINGLRVNGIDDDLIHAQSIDAVRTGSEMPASVVAAPYREKSPTKIRSGSAGSNVIS